MKKSSILYWGMHVIILLIPFLFLSTLRIKVAAGDIVDLIAQEAAGTHIYPLPVIHEIEINNSIPAHGSQGGLALKVIVSDSLQQLKMDTTTAKYISYKMEGDKLMLSYDYERDHKDQAAEIEKMQEDRDRWVDNDYSNNEKRTVFVYVQSNITSLIARRSNLYLSLPDNTQKLNDLNVLCYTSNFTLEAPDKWTRNEAGDQIRKLYRHEHRLGLHLLENSSARLNNVGYIKDFDLEIKDESRMEDYYPTETFHLTIDKKSSFMMDVNDLAGVTIKYE